MEEDMHSALLPLDQHDEMEEDPERVAEIQENKRNSRYSSMAFAVILSITVLVVVLVTANSEDTTKPYDLNLHRNQTQSSSKVFASKAVFDSTPAVSYSLQDKGNNHHTVQLTTAEGDNLFSVVRDASKTTFTILNSTIVYNHDQEASNSSIQRDQQAMQRLFKHPSAASLPALSRHLGEEKSLTGYDYPASLIVHKLAMAYAETYEGNGQVQRRSSEARRDGCPWTGCQESGHPLPASSCGNGCVGMCGKGCSCWHWVCGDCCWHQGCYQHDTQSCGHGYLNFDCLTAKGVLWGSSTPTGHAGDC